VLTSKKALINMHNKDNECFRWCHVRHLNPHEIHLERIKKSDRSLINSVDYSGIEFPVKLTRVNKIEKQNSININIFGYESKQVFPLQSSNERFDKTMNLLYISKVTRSHYVLIKDFNKLLFDQTKHKERKHFCMCCLLCFSSEDILKSHTEDCLVINGEQAVRMPKEDSKIKFTNDYKQEPVPYVIYADFEILVEKVAICKPHETRSYSESYQSHK